jgi:hypothetical protein
MPRLVEVRVFTSMVRTAPIMPNRTNQRKAAGIVLFIRDASIITPGIKCD